MFEGLFQSMHLPVILGHGEDGLSNIEVRSRQLCGFDLWQVATHSIQLAPALV